MTAEPLEPALLLASEMPRPGTPALWLVPPAAEQLATAALPTHARHFVQAVVEIVEGDRSPTQLMAWTAPRVYQDIVRRARLRALQRRHAAAELRPRTRVVSVKVFQPRADVAEVSARAERGTRSVALAVRLEAVGLRWVCTALEWA